MFVLLQESRGGAFVCGNMLYGIQSRCLDDLTGYTNISKYHDFIYDSLQRKNVGAKEYAKLYSCFITTLCTILNILCLIIYSLDIFK